MKCGMGMGSGDLFTLMMVLKATVVVWILIVPLMFLKRLDKLLKLLEDKKK